MDNRNRPLRGCWILGRGNPIPVTLDWDDTETEQVAMIALDASRLCAEARAKGEHSGTGRVTVEIAGEKKAEIQFADGAIEYVHRIVGGRMRLVRYYTTTNARGKPDITAIRPGGEAA